MKAAVFSDFGGPEVVRIDDMPVPEPGPGEVRIAVRAAAMNHLDLWIRRGLPIKIIMPHIGGSDVAGVVDSVGPPGSPGCGPQVSGVETGARVVVDPSLEYDWYDGASSGPNLPPREFRIIGEHTQGGFAEFCVVPAANLLEIPQDISFETAAAASLVGVTAWRALMVRGGLRAGERVLVTGASGGVSSMAIQMARLAGAQVFAITKGEESVARARELGAHVVYDRDETDWNKAIFQDTGKEGVDLVPDPLVRLSGRLASRPLPLGVVFTFGATTGAMGETEIRMVFWKQLSILGSTMGTPKDYRQAMRLVFDGKVKPAIHTVLPLSQARQAHKMLEAGQVFGKVVLTP